MDREVLIRPLVTEKMTSSMEGGHYAFVVRKDANKLEIRRAVQARYPEIRIKEVRTMVVRGKHKRQMTKAGAVAGRASSYKKAIVTLQPDSARIDFFEEV